MSTLPPPFRLVAKLRNNRLIRAREALGLSCPQAAKAIGVCYAALVQLEGMQESPVGVTGWRPVALKIAEWYGYIPEDLWPDCVLAVETIYATLELDPANQRAFSDMRARTLLPAPDQAYVEKELQARVQQVLATLTPAEQDVLVKRFGLDGNGGMTLEDTAKTRGVFKERIRQIEAKALRKIRHPSREKRLRVFVEE